MRAIVVWITGISLAVTCGVEAQEIDEDQFFPGVARLAGEPPSQWVSDVTVHNLMEDPVEIGFLFLRERTAHGIDDLVISEDHRFVLAARETRTFEDVLGGVFGITENVKGGLLVTTNPDILGGPSGGEELNIQATMRTYDVSSPVGTYGQSIPSSSFVENTSGEPSVITGVRNDGRFRSNLGLINGSLEEITIHYVVRRADGYVLAQGTKVLPSISIRQWRVRDLIGLETVEGPMTVDLWMDPDDVRDPCLATFDGGTSFSAYVSKVDSDTQDAEFIYAAPAWVATAECD